MTPERWKAISAALDRALEFPADRRADFVAGLAKQDAELAAEVSSLLKQQDSASGPNLDSVADGLWQAVQKSPISASDPSSVKRDTIQAEHIPEQVGCYRIQKQIGKGGMGAVFRAKDGVFHRSLAVKVLAIRHRHSEELRQRFMDEAQLMGQLQHPGIPPVYELGTLPDGRPFFAMKLIKGQTLSELLRERKTNDSGISRLLGVFDQVCQTVAYVHDQGVIHRDLKPANIMVGAFGEVQVMDWGLAKVLSLSPRKSHNPADTANEAPSTIFTVRGESSEAQTLAGQAMGTPAYMAPEQSRGEADAIDERCDVFGLGAILCEILTGEPPFVGKPHEVLYKSQCGSVEEAFARLDHAGIEPELASLAKKCLAPERGHRLPNAGAVAKATADYLLNVQERLHQAEITSAESKIKLQEGRKRRRVERALLGSIACIVLLALGTAYWVRAHNDQMVEQNERKARILEGESREIERTAKGEYAKAEAIKLDSLDDLANATDEFRRVLHTVDVGRESLRKLAAEVHHFEPLEKIRKQAEEKHTLLRRESQFYTDLNAAFEARGDIRDSDYRSHATVVFGRSGIDHYAKAFRKFGIDVLDLGPADAKEKLLACKFPVLVAEALTDWVIILGKCEEAKKLASLADQIDADEIRTLVRRSTLEGNANDLVRNLITLEKTPEARTTVLLADALQRLGEDHHALNLLKRAHEEHRRDFWINDIHGVLLVRLSPMNSAEAIVCFHSALTSRPDAYFVYANLADAHLVDGQPKDAEMMARAGLKLRPGNERLRRSLSAALTGQGRYVEAIHELDPDEGSVELSPLSLQGIAEVHLARGDAAKALVFAERALQKQEDFTPAIITKALTLLLMQKDVKSVLKTGIDLVERHEYTGYMLQAYTHKVLGQKDEMARVLETAQPHCQGMAEYHELMAHLADLRGDGNQALAFLRKAFDLSRASVPHTLNLAKRFMERKQFHVAQEILLTGLERRGNSTPLRECLGLVLAQTRETPYANERLVNVIANLSPEEQVDWRSFWVRHKSTPSNPAVPTLVAPSSVPLQSNVSAPVRIRRDVPENVDRGTRSKPPQ